MGESQGVLLYQVCMGESQGVLLYQVCMGESQGVLTRCVWVRVGEFLPGVYG